MSWGSKMKLAGTQDRSSGPYPSQSTRYWTPRPRRLDWSNLRTCRPAPLPPVEAAAVPAQQDTEDSRTNFTLETWNVGWILIVLGNLSRTATGLMTLSILNGPMNLGASFRDSTRSGRSLVDNHTCWPTW